MIVQITVARNEKILIEELFPLWDKYVDGFVFLIDKRTTDNTIEYLNKVKDKYNILEILETNPTGDGTKCPIETDYRQLLFDTAKKYSNKIICLDADEYLDGSLSKNELESLLDNHQDTVFHLKWVQYTSVNTIRVDGPWKNNLKDRIGIYNSDCKFQHTQMHSTHLPIPPNQLVIPPEKLFIAHLQWLDKTYVAIKQYYWKVEDYVNNKLYGVEVAGNEAYNQSINDFEWEEEYTFNLLKINPNLISNLATHNNYRLPIIKERTKIHNIPNLGDWGLNIHNSIPMYFCTAADSKHYPILLNLIGSLHKHNYQDIEDILVYDLGLDKNQKEELSNIKKVSVCDVDKVNPSILTNIETGVNRSVKGLFSWKPVIIKDALDKYPYILYLDAGTTILKPLNNLFKHISQNGYLFFDCGATIKWMTTKYLINKLNLNSDENKGLLDDNNLCMSFQKTYKILQMMAHAPMGGERVDMIKHYLVF
jgi:hypothetical protein